MINIFSEEAMKGKKGEMFMICDPAKCNQYVKSPTHTPPCFEYTPLDKDHDGGLYSE